MKTAPSSCSPRAVTSPPAVILAAGRGTRLGDLTREIPKCFLTVDGKPLLERQVDVLHSLGIAPVFVVTGFARGTFSHLWSRSVREIENTEWDRSNNIVTLHKAAEAAADGFLLLNSDVLFAPTLFERLIQSPAANALMVDMGKPLTDEEMVVHMADQRVTAIAKTLSRHPIGLHTGEFIGLAKFDALGSRALFGAIARLVSRGMTSEWYERAIAEILPQVHIQAVDTDGVPWIEIDTPEDLARARGEVWERIQAADVETSGPIP